MIATWISGGMRCRSKGIFMGSLGGRMDRTCAGWIWGMSDMSRMVPWFLAYTGG